MRATVDPCPDRRKTPTPDMAGSAAHPFPPDALDANRRGELSDDQRSGFGALAGYRRRSALSSAALLVAGALLVVFFASPTASPVLRMLVPVTCLAITAVLVVRSVTGGDALTRDLRQGRVESVEGAVGKRRLSVSGRSVTTYLLDVGDATFKVAPFTYDAAPDAGRVRAYFLPRSRNVVNLERLPDRPVDEREVTAQGILDSLRATILSPGPQANEARAKLAGIGNALKGAFAESAAPPQARDPRPLEEAILGTWSNQVMKVTFSSGGRVTAHMLGAIRDGHWSVEGGRLRADITDHQETADAWVVGNQLTIAVEGRGLTLTRASGA